MGEALTEYVVWQSAAAAVSVIAVGAVGFIVKGFNSRLNAHAERIDQHAERITRVEEKFQTIDRKLDALLRLIK